MSVLRTLIIKELRQFRRNPFLPKLVVGFPLAIVLILPWIANMDVKGVSVGIVDADRSDVSRRITSHVEASEYLRLHDLYTDYPSALADLEDGHIDAILEIPNGFGHSLHATPKRLSIWANGVNAMKGSLGSQYLMQTVMRALPTGIAPMQPSFESSEIVNCELTSLKLLHSAEPASSLCSRSIATLSIVNYYNPTMDYKHFMIPALMIMVMVMVGGFLPALNLVSEKELGTIEQINVTPVSRLVFTLSKLIPFWIICLLELALCMTLAFLVYGLPVAGSVGAIFLAALLFIIIMSSIGVIIANLSETMQQTMFLMLFIVLSFILLSGLMTPVESMPLWTQHFTRLLPPTYMVEIMRAVYLRGTTVAELSGSYLALATFALIFATLTSFTYRKRG